MDAFEKLGTICLVLSIITVLPLMWLYKGNLVMVALIVIAFCPIMWIAGLNILGFFTKPFSEKGMTGVFTWIISIALALVVYAVFFFALLFIFRDLLHT